MSCFTLHGRSYSRPLPSVLREVPLTLAQHEGTSGWAPSAIVRQVILGALLFLVPVNQVAAQDQGRLRAEPYVPAAHWSREALWRLAAAGLLSPAEVLTTWPVRQARVRRLLADAVTRSGVEAGTRALAPGFAARFEEEYPSPSGERTLPGGAHAEAGWRADSGIMRAGASFWVDGVGWRYPGPSERADVSAPFARTTVGVGISSAVAASATLRAASSRVVAEEAYVVTSAGPLDVWAGRRGLSAGSAHRTGIVLSEGATFTGGALELSEGVRPPRFLRGMGLIRGALLLARMSRSGPYAHPWFLAQRVSVAPDPRVSIGATRAAMFGGEENIGISARTVALMLLGFSDIAGKDSDFENQVFSMDAMWSTGVGSLPLALYTEGGIDDTGFAFMRVSGWIFGAELPSIAGVSGLTIGLEHVRFPKSCCRYPSWYRHGALAEGWTDRGSLIGHPLGGHGTEWSLRWRFDRPGIGVVSGARIFARTRGAENLYAPDREGRSNGGAVEVILRGSRRLRVKTDAQLEYGHGDWRNSSVMIAVEHTF
jgi:hypothetical protein